MLIQPSSDKKNKNKTTLNQHIIYKQPSLDIKKHNHPLTIFM